jgi:bacillopeptidase F
LRHRKQRRLRVFRILATLFMIFSFITPGYASAQSNTGSNSFPTSSNTKVSQEVLDDFKENEKVTFLIKFKEQADTEQVAIQAKAAAQKASLSATKTELRQRSAVVSDLKATSLQSQESVKQYLEQEEEKGNVEKIESFYIVNAMAVTATKAVAENISSFSEVEKILPNQTIYLNSGTSVETEINEAVEAMTTTSTPWNVDAIGAPQVWDKGIDGTGVVVASIGTGVQWDHPALKEKYRGYDPANPDQPNHEFNWDDNAGTNKVPVDPNGLGTKVMGAIVGGEVDGSNPIGIAPGAKWISVRAFTANGSTGIVNLMLAAEWLLAPKDSKGVPHPEMAPDIIANTWGGARGVDEIFRPMIKNWIAAGILPVFGTGDEMPSNPNGVRSIVSPANLPEVLAVGATNEQDELASFSLKGPSPYGEFKPDISAPGVNIRTSSVDGGYVDDFDTTAVAAAQVVGAAALLLQANSTLSGTDLKTILLQTATPLTDETYPDSPNNGYGYGLVNINKAVEKVSEGVSKITGHVTTEGVDTIQPTFQHTPPTIAYGANSLRIHVNAQDNVSVKEVQLKYRNFEEDEWSSIEAYRQVGNQLDGIYEMAIPGSAIYPLSESITYKWQITDYSNNSVESEEYKIPVKLNAFTLGYFTDFDTMPAVGWSWKGGHWKIGVPTTGPNSAYSGSKVIATNTDGDYLNNMDSNLMVPPVFLPKGKAYLHFKQWYSFAEGDHANVYVSVDNGATWTSLSEYTGNSSGWVDGVVDLSDYTDRFIRIGFHVYTDEEGTAEGWYLDDVKLTDTPLSDLSGSSFESVKVEYMETLEIEEIFPTEEVQQTNLVTKENAQISSINQLPLDASISVLETGRSVQTNPTDGSYSMVHEPGTYTLQAEAYGYRTASQSIEIGQNNVTTSDFVLEPLAKGTITGTVTNETTGEPIEGAKVLLKEDSVTMPVKTDENGHFSISGYEGTYTLHIFAANYDDQDVQVTIEGNKEIEQNISLKSFFGIPGEIAYDDGTRESARKFWNPNSYYAVKMSLPEGKKEARLTKASYLFQADNNIKPGMSEFQVAVYAADGPQGAPATKLLGPIDATAKRNGEWTVVNLAAEEIIVTGDFYVVYIQQVTGNDAPGLGVDESNLFVDRNWQFNGRWSTVSSPKGNFMIRAGVHYDATPVITSPKVDGTITTEETITVEGMADPNTDVHIYNHDEEVAVVTSNESGAFVTEVTLHEGENVLTARADWGDGITGPSNSVTLVLDKGVDPAVPGKGKLAIGDQPLAHITFSLYSTGEKQVWYDFTTDANGEFTHQLPDGEYRVDGIWVSPTWYPLNKTYTIENGLVNGIAEFEVNVLDYVIPAPEPGKWNVVGTLVNGTTALTNVTFSIHSTDNKWYDAKSDSTGKFAFTLPDGTYEVDGIWDELKGKWYELNQKFTVKDGSLEGAAELRIDVNPPATSFKVTGTLTKGTTALSDVVFSVHTTTGEETWYDTQTDSNGGFGFNLQDGTYMLEGVWLDAEGKWYVLQKEFTVTGIGTFNIDVLEDGPVAATPNVTGVLTKGAIPLGNTVFSIHTTTGVEKWYDTVSDANGNFGFVLPDGAYKLEGIWVDSEGKWYVLNLEFTVTSGKLVGEEQLVVNIANSSM